MEVIVGWLYIDIICKYRVYNFNKIYWISEKPFRLIQLLRICLEYARLNLLVTANFDTHLKFERE